MKLQVMRKHKRLRTGNLVLWFAIMAILGGGFQEEAWGLGWERTENQSWTYIWEAGGNRLCGDWAWIDGRKYHFDSSGEMDAGWTMIADEWYFFCPAAGETEGQLMTGWQWIDGKCYYLEEEEAVQNRVGVMYRSSLTPDGYYVGPSGAWLDAAGNEVYEEGKGILTVRQENEKLKEMKYSGGNGGNRGGGGRSHGNTAARENSTNGDGEEGKHSQMAEKEDSGSGNIRIDEAATPSEAVRVKWEIHFVEQGHYENQIFRLQKGESYDGDEVSVDFPEEIVGRDGYTYRSAEPGPKVIQVSGTGIQKYYVEYRKGEKVPAGGDGENDEFHLRLERWLDAAKKADLEITGKYMEENQIITTGSQESDNRMKNLVSMIRDNKRHEIYLIAMNHVPSPLVIGETFPDAADISVLVMDEFIFSESEYCVVRIGLKMIRDQETCRHKMETTELIPAGCLSSGSQTERCSRCGFTETCLLPPMGHCDSDCDGICNVCDEEINGGDTAEPRHFRIGDIQMRTIGKCRLRFRCIDDDYSDGNGNNQSTALFLCDSIIRSDIDSDSSQIKKMSFGENNNYKTSNIRSWLNRNAADTLFDGQISYTGINTACAGVTPSGRYEQFEEEDLHMEEKPFQLMEDKIFILSVEEAVRYREYLWKFEGAGTNNPETQISACSRGYYLRTPQYAGESEFEYGDGIYVVDLISGNIHPASIFSTTVGIRPAMTVRQYDYEIEAK